jgi:hypothetical protein
MSKKKHRKSSSSSSSSKRSKRSGDSAKSSSSSKKKSEKSKKSSKLNEIEQPKSDATPLPPPSSQETLSSDVNLLNQTAKDLLDTQLMKAPDVPSQTSDSSKKKESKSSSSSSSSGKRKKKSRSKSRTKEENKAMNEKTNIESLPLINKKIILELEPLSAPNSPSTIPLPSPQPVPPPAPLDTLLMPASSVNTLQPIITKKPIKIEIKAESKLSLLLPNVFSSPALLESFSPPTPPHQQSGAASAKSNYYSVPVANDLLKDDSKVRNLKLKHSYNIFLLIIHTAFVLKGEIKSEIFFLCLGKVLRVQ